MKKISLIIAGKHMTSITLEEEFASALKQIALEKKQTINQIVTEIDATRGIQNLSSAVRIYILRYFKGLKNG